MILILLYFLPGIVQDYILFALLVFYKWRAADQRVSTTSLRNFLSVEAPISEAVHQLSLKVWSTGRVPSEWRDDVIISLYKGKGPCSESISYRPIKLLSVPGKVFSHVLLNRLEPLFTCQHHTQQSGFTNVHRQWTPSWCAVCLRKFTGSLVGHYM